MGFKKGQSGNPTGRKKGVRNKRTTEVLSRAQKMIEMIENHPNFANALDSLTPKELLMLRQELLEYTEPKLARTEQIVTNVGPKIVRVIHSLQPPAIQPPLVEDAEFKIIE